MIFEKMHFFDNLYLRNGWSNQFGVLGNVIGNEKDYLKKEVVHCKKAYFS